MSLILDALKKSEAERQRGQVPNLLSPLPTPPSHSLTPAKSNSPWLVAVIFLLAVLISGYFYLRAGSPESNAADSPQVNPESRQEIPPEVRESSSSAPPIPPEPATLPIPPPSAPVTQPAEVAPVNSTPEIPAAQATIEATPAPEARIASMAEMPAEQRQQLPALKLSMHVFSSEAGKRFAIIDGQRINEGSVIGNAVVEQILQDGVVLSVQGQSYLLPRP